jgi:GDSL-like lipase/acylhydrolase family protein
MGSQTGGKGKLVAGALMLASTVLAVGVMEFVSRLFEPAKVVEQPTDNQYEFYRFDPILGWTNEPNINGIFRRAEFSFPVRINSHAMRYRELSVEHRPDVFRVAVLGDSFTWGIGASDEERFTGRVEAVFEGRVEMLNFGVSGYGPVQYLLQLPQVLKFAPDAVLIAFCLCNDFGDNVFWRRYGYYKPFAKLAGADAIEIDGYPLPNAAYFRTAIRRDYAWQQILNSYSSLYRRFEQLLGETTLLTDPGQRGPEYFAENDIDLYIDLPEGDIGNLRRAAKAEVQHVNELILNEISRQLFKHNVALAVLTVPTKCEYGQFFPSLTQSPNLRARDALRSATGRQGIPLIDTVEHLAFEDFWSIDNHWRPSGHAKVAGAVVDWMRQNWIAR